MSKDKNTVWAIAGLMWVVVVVLKVYFLMGVAVYFTLWSIDLIVNLKD